MRILFVHGYGLEGSGSSIYARNLAYSLLRQGHAVRVLAHTSGADETAVRALSEAGGEFERLPPETLATTYPRAEFARAPLVRRMPETELRRAARTVATAAANAAADFDADLVIANHFLHVAHGAVTAARALGIPSVVVSHGTDIEYACAESEAARSLGRETFRRATCRVALNGIAQARIAEVLEARAADIAIVPPGIDTRTFAPGDPTERPRRAVQVGRLLLDKGPHVSIAALCMALPEFPDLELVLVGDGPDRQSLQALVQHIDQGDLDAAQRCLVDMGTSTHRARILSPTALALFGARGRQALAALKGRLASAVTFTGYRSSAEVADLLRSARLALLPSLVPECYPLTLLEALACGCYVQASPLGGTSEVLRRVEEVSLEPAASRVISPERPVVSLLNGLRFALPSWSQPAAFQLAERIRGNHDWTVVAEQLLTAVPGVGKVALSQPG